MEYTWYIDSFFANLFLVDMIVFGAAMCLMGGHCKVKRSILAAFSSAVAETVLYLILPKYVLYRGLIICVINPLVVLGLFYPRKKRDLVSGYLLITSFFLVLGGMQTLFLYWISVNKGLLFWNILLAIGAFGVCLWQKHVGRRLDRICQVVLTIQGKQVHLNACIDTGNFLRDPFTGKPVNVISSVWVEKMQIPLDCARYIPYHTVGCEKDLMQVVTIDKMLIKTNGKETVREWPVIGLARENLFEMDDIQMILHSEML